MTMPSASPYLQSTGQYTVSPLTKRLADFTYRLNGLHDKILSSAKYKQAGPVQYRLQRFGALLTQWDISHFNTFFKGRLAIPSNPMGMLLFILFPCVIGSRVLRAKERDSTGTEIGDVLRRDFMTLIPFVFMVPLAVNAINGFKQKRDGINLARKVDPRDVVSKAYTYSELASAFDLNNPKKLEVLIAEGNGRGLHQAIQKNLSMYKTVLEEVPEGKTVLESYQNFANIIAQMAHEGSVLKGTMEQPKTNSRLQKLSESAYTEMLKAQQALLEMKKVLAANDTEAGRQVEARVSKSLRHIPRFSYSLIHYAKMKRLPADLLSIALTIVAMGWAPVALNNHLSRRRLEKMRQEKIHTQGIQPQRNPFQVATAN